MQYIWKCSGFEKNAALNLMATLFFLNLYNYAKDVNLWANLIKIITESLKGKIL